MAAHQNHCHRALSVLKNEEGRRKEIKAIEQMAEANGFQQSTVQKVFQQAGERKQVHKLCVDKYSGSMPSVRKHTSKVLNLDQSTLRCNC
jgi:hypothetical protein